MPADPKCRNCRHFHAQDPSKGECRAHPPLVAFWSPTGELKTTFPIVTNEMRCGEYQAG